MTRLLRFPLIGTLSALITLTAGGADAVPLTPLTRLARDEPEILLTPGGRTGVCDVLKFSADGSRLYAVGEDKVVHVWSVGAGRLVPGEPFHWNTFRERRGSIFAMALHEDPRNPQLAIAGAGKSTADVAVFDPRTGKLTAALSAALDANYTASEVVWCLAFGPGGKELAVGDAGGNVWVWRVAGGGPGPRVRRAATAPTPRGYQSRVVWVGYLPDGRLAYARRDGGVYLETGDVLFRWAGEVDKVTASGDGRWLAALPSRDTLAGSRVEARSLPDGKTGRSVPFATGRFPDRFALDKTGERLAVGVADFSEGTGGKPKKPFLVEPPGEVVVYDLRPAEPTRVAGVAGLDMRPDQIAFHPDGTRLATAGGNDHATILWAIDGGRLTEITADRGQARSLWGVGASADGRHLYFKDRRNPDPAGPNDRGAGGWTAFDLQNGDWVADAGQPVPPEETRGGWTVAFDPTSDQVWYAVGPGGAKQKLPLDPLRDDFPRCYTFLPADRKGAVRLAVGHLWGVSVFELAPGEAPKRVRRLVGHAGYVTSVAPALGGRGLVSCGRDQVVALWSLADFPSHPVLGAAFTDEPDGTFVVTAVDTGSPAEEAGLSRGDVVTKLLLGGSPRPVPRAEWAAKLKSAEPGQEVAFYLTRDGLTGEAAVKTALLHRPVARFFPTRDREWVLYTYRQCYYNCSTNGDDYLAWFVSTDRADVAPEVLPVERFRMLHRPDKVRDVVGQLTREPCKPVLPDLFPPDVAIEVVKNPAAAVDHEIVAVVTPRARQDGKVNPIDKVEVWVNGHYRAGLKPMAGEKVEAGKPIRVPFTVPASSLRAGTNEVRAVAVARDAGTGESRPVRLLGPETGKTRHLYGVVAGINEYDAFGAGTSLTCAVRDAERVREAWAARFAGAGQVGRGLAADRLKLLTDESVSREEILGAVEKARATAGPDDLFVLFLAGHGIPGRAIGGQDEWYYAIPRTAGGPLKRTDWTGKTPRLRDACLRDNDLFNALSALRCQTVVILDCCHSGAASRSLEGVTTQVRSLRPYGYGPIVMAACAAAQQSWESDGQGYFTSRVVRALGGEFGTADADKDRRLSAAELFEYVRAGVEQDVRDLTDDSGKRIQQTPQIVPSVDRLRERGDPILVEPTARK